MHRLHGSLTLLGIAPDKVEDGYGWIEPGPEEEGRLTRAVKRFWEKPAPRQAHILYRRRALWNTFICTAYGHELWEMAQRAVPDIYEDFLSIRSAIETPQAESLTHQIYCRLRAANFSSDICEPWVEKLRVLPVEDIGWSDWGSVERIIGTFEQLGRKAELAARLSSGNCIDTLDGYRPHDLSSCSLAKNSRRIIVG
jgi:mannose-1-phosphate guanylyltransferase